MTSKNLETARKVVEIFEDSDRFDELDQFFTEDYVRHGGRDYTLAEFKEVLASLNEGIPDIELITFEGISDGDKTAYRWESKGTHMGTYMGVIPTGKETMAKGITISRFRDGRICEEWASWNEISVLHDLGIIPLG